MTFDADPDPRLTDPDPTPDSSHFFRDFKEAKKKIFQAHFLQP